MSWAGLAQGHESAPLKARPHIDVNKWLLELPIPADLEAQWLEKTEASRKCCTWLYLIDNNSTDLWQAAVAPYRERLTVFSRPRAHAQRDHYNSILPMLKQKHLDDWVFVLDIDEYLYPSGLGTIASVVQTNLYFQTHAHISIRWKMFGSSGKVLQPPSIRCSFVNRMDENNKKHSFWRHESIEVKSGVAIRYLQHFNVHSHVYWNPDFTHTVKEQRARSAHRRWTWRTFSR